MTPTTPIPDGSVIITPTQMYDEVRATREAVQRLDGKLDQLPKQVSDHETRIRALERARWPLPSLGALSGVGALAVALWQGTGH